MAKTTNIPEVDKVIGKGIKYPVKFGVFKHSQLFELSSGPDKINESIKMIFDTPIGSRYNNPNFGSNLNYLIFEPNDTILKDLLYYSVHDSLSRWEKRITIKNISFQTFETDSSINPNQINIRVEYIINATHQQGSYVYPFVKNAMPMSEIIQGRQAFNLGSFSMNNTGMNTGR